MRFIPTRFHGVLDYIAGIFLIVAPWIFDFSDAGTATWLMVIVGTAVLLQTAFTDFEVGLFRVIPMRLHLLNDFILGTGLAVSPWLFNFADRVYLPHLILGIFMVLAALTTHRVTSQSYANRHIRPEHIRDM